MHDQSWSVECARTRGKKSSFASWRSGWLSMAATAPRACATRIPGVDLCNAWHCIRCWTHSLASRARDTLPSLYYFYTRPLVNCAAILHGAQRDRRSWASWAPAKSADSLLDGGYDSLSPFHRHLGVSVPFRLDELAATDEEAPRWILHTAIWLSS